MGHPTFRSRTLGSAAVLAVSLSTVLAACGGGGATKASGSGSPNSTPSNAAAPAGSPAGSPAGGDAAGGSFNGASGSVAAISGSSMEVQNPSIGQTTVNWTGTTTFDQTVGVTATSLTAGDCVTVTGTTANGTITARSVSVAATPASGTCPGFAGAGRGPFPGGAHSGSPTGSAPGSSVPGRFTAHISFAAGKVVSSSAGQLVIFGTSFEGRGTRTATTSPPTTAAPTNVTVTLTSSTTFSQVRPATAGSLAVGDCVVANGPADSTGAVTARTIRITSTGGKSCTTGFGRFGGSTPGGAAPSASSSAND